MQTAPPFRDIPDCWGTNGNAIFFLESPDLEEMGDVSATAFTCVLVLCAWHVHATSGVSARHVKAC